MPHLTTRTAIRRPAVVLLALLVTPVTAAHAQDRPATTPLKQANTAFSAQDYRTAAVLYEQALTEEPANTDLYFFLGNSYDNLHKPALRGDLANDANLTKAVEFYRRASEEAKTPAIKHLAMQYLVNAYNSPDKVNDPAQAELVLLGMIQLDPADPTNYFVLSRIYEDVGDYVQAEQQLLTARSQRPTDAAVYMNLAGFYQRQGKFERMIEAVRERTWQEPNNPEAFYTLATFYWERATRDVSLSDVQRANYAQAGLDAVNQALSLKNDYFEALTYKNLLLRTQSNLSKNPLEQARLLQDADELRKQAEELRTQQRATPTNGAAK